jgi:cell division protein FtsW
MKALALKLSAIGPRRRSQEQPVEYSLLLTATLCLLAFGVVMVFSASSTTQLLGSSGDSAYYLKRTVAFALLGLLVMHLLARNGLRLLSGLTPLILVGSVCLLVAVLLPGIGMQANGAQRWIGAGLVQVQPSEVAKFAVVLYGAYLLTTRPRMVRSIEELGPFLAVVGLVCLLVVIEPDLGTTMVICLSAAALLVCAGVQMRHLALLGGVLAAVVILAILIEPYRVARFTGFLDPATDPGGAGFQAIQAKLALGSGGVFGVGLGESLQKAFYLPEAHTDMIAAVIGEELGLAGMAMLIGLYGMFGYAGLRTAQRARDRYGKLLATGLTSMVMVQATINLFAVLGLAPLTGVPLPFVSYGNSSMLVLLAAVGLLLNIAAGGTAGVQARPATSGGARLRVVSGGRPTGATTRRRSSSNRGKGRDRGGGNRRTRRSGARRRGRAAG